MDGMGLGSVECHRLECSNRQAQDTFGSTVNVPWVTSVSLIFSNFLLTIKFSTWLQPRTLSDFLFCMLTVSSPVLLLRHEAMHSA